MIHRSAGPLATIRASAHRMPSLDALRAVAVLLVLGAHMNLLSPRAFRTRIFESDLWFGLAGVANIWNRGGWIGVDLFFVLSGFLVSGILFSEHRRHGCLDIRRFLVRRGLKIYPAYYLLLVATVLVFRIQGRTLDLRQLVGELFFMQGYTCWVWLHTWSLAVEEHFYFALPFVLMWIEERRYTDDPFARIRPLFWGVATLVLALRCLNALFRPDYQSQTHLWPSHLRLDSLLFGVLLAYYYYYHRDRFLRAVQPYRRWLCAGGAALLTPAFVFPLETSPLIYTLGFSLFYLASGLLVVTAVTSTWRNSTFLNTMAYVGSHSYSIYLVHVPVLVWGIAPLVAALRVRGLEVSPGVAILAYMAVSLAAGIVLARLVELPVLGWRDGRFPSRSADLLTVSAGVFSNHLGQQSTPARGTTEERSGSA